MTDVSGRHEVPVIAIDGPSGSGKGTICRLLADTLGWHLLDSGALYRVTALAAIRAGVDISEEIKIASLAAELPVVFDDNMDGNERILLAGHDITSDVRSETCGEYASQVAALPAVREALVARQLAFAQSPGLVADGRDMGTEIFPRAPLKIFLTASAAERAERRYKQLKDNNIDVSLPALLRDIEQRDQRDASRSLSPLRPAS
ncbi:MAG: (d)CMP kinase, partial [Pseudomonadota bacterium]